MLSVGCLVAALATALPARADFSEGLAAYDAGDYYAAYLAWLPLAKAGDGDSQAAIADLYLSGRLHNPASANELRRIQATAAWWYTQAARCGHVVAQLNLGDLYMRGIGVQRDPVAGAVWLALAARQGNEWATRRRAEAMLRLSPAQRAEAAERIENWSADADCATR